VVRVKVRIRARIRVRLRVVIACGAFPKQRLMFKHAPSNRWQ
jgi:hypothetical protein